MLLKKKKNANIAIYIAYIWHQKTVGKPFAHLDCCDKNI